MEPKREPWEMTDYCGEPLTPREEAIATAAGQKAIRSVQKKFQESENCTEFAEWLKGQL